MKIAITGGAGYVGSRLVPYLLRKDHQVTVLDTFWYGDYLGTHHLLTKIKGDIRRKADLRDAFKNKDAVIHLACVSNDPSFDMNPKLGKEVNYSCFKDILSMLKQEEVERFIYASSSSVYGMSDEKEVTEESIKKPLTDYSTFKLACELELQTYGTGGIWTILRPATVCGYSPRMRLDLVVNILTIQALVNKKITVFGGDQLRPNINIKDMILAYEKVLMNDDILIDGQIFNVGFENNSVYQLANIVKETLDDHKIDIASEPSTDNRSYHVSSDKISRLLGFKPKHTIIEAIQSIKTAYDEGLLKDPLTNPEYHNIKQMKGLGL